MDKASGEVANDPISEGEVEKLTGPAGPSQAMREGSSEVIDMQKPWVEGPKGKKVSESSVLFSSAEVEKLVAVSEITDAIQHRGVDNVHRIPRCEVGRVRRRRLVA